MNTQDELLSLVVKGNRDAFRTFYKLYSERVYNTALSYLKDESDAKEITQDVFIRIYKNLSKFRGDAAVNTWIYRITINISLNFLKRKKRRSIFNFGLESVDKPDFEHPGVLLEQKEDSKKLFAVIDTLSDRQKTAFILSYIENLPRAEVAEIMELSLKATESLLQRAKVNLRNKLKKSFPHRRKGK